MKCDVPEPRVLLVEHKAQLDKYKVRYSLFLLDFFFFFEWCRNNAICPGLEAEWLMGFQSDVYQ